MEYLFSCIFIGLLCGLPTYWIRLSWKCDFDDDLGLALLLAGVHALVLSPLLFMGNLDLSGLALGQSLALCLWSVLSVGGRSLNRAKTLPPDAWREGPRVPFTPQFSIASIMAATAAICAPLAVARAIDPDAAIPALGGVGFAVFLHGAALLARRMQLTWIGLMALLAVSVVVLCSGILVKVSTLGVYLWWLGVEAVGVFAWQTVLDRLGQRNRTEDNWSARVSQEADESPGA